MSREAHVRFWESVRVRFPRATQLEGLDMLFIPQLLSKYQAKGVFCILMFKTFIFGS
jgi:hypothetical protein